MASLLLLVSTVLAAMIVLLHFLQGLSRILIVWPFGNSCSRTIEIEALPCPGLRGAFVCDRAHVGRLSDELPYFVFLNLIL